MFYSRSNHNILTREYFSTIYIFIYSCLVFIIHTFKKLYAALFWFLCQNYKLFPVVGLLLFFSWSVDNSAVFMDSALPAEHLFHPGPVLRASGQGVTSHLPLRAQGSVDP